MKNVKIAFLIITTFLISTSGKSQFAWSKLASLPEGASVIDLAIDNTNRVYALTYFLSEIYYTNNNGLSWTKLPGTFDYWNATEIEIDSSTNTLYVGTLSEGLYWTSNLGITWQNEPFYTLPLSGTHAFINKTIRKPLSNIIICSEPILTSSSTIYRSSDAGITWVSSTAPFGGANDFCYLTNGKLLAGTENGVFQSSDDGVSWSPVNAGMSLLQVTSVVEKPQNSLLFASVNFNFASNDTSGIGVFVSSDGGLTWLNQSSGMTDLRITDLVIDNSTGHIYATYPGGIYRSTNNGQSWTAVNVGVGNDDYTTIIKNSSGVFAGSRKNGIAFSSNPINGWNYRNSGMGVNTISGLSIGLNGSIHVLDNANTGVYGFLTPSWVQLNNGLPSSSGKKIAKDQNGILYASYLGTSNILYKSNNQGATWNPIGTIPLASNIFWAQCSSLKIDANNNVYVVVEYSSQNPQAQEVYRSSDNGATWSLIYTLDVNTYVAIEDIDLSSNGSIYITTTNFNNDKEFLYFSNWSSQSSIASYTVNQQQSNVDLVVAPNDSIYVLQDNNLYKRQGVNGWQLISNTPWSSSQLIKTKLYINNLMQLFVTVENQGVYFSADDGISWSNISTGLPTYSPPFSSAQLIHVYDLQFDNNNVPYAISTDLYSNDKGVYKYTVQTTTTDISNYLNKVNSLVVYPNPFTDQLNVKSSEICNYELFDLAGRVVKQGIINERSETKIETTDLSPGMFFIKVYDRNSSHSTKLIKTKF